jgi:hypothetical protein
MGLAGSLLIGEWVVRVLRFGAGRLLPLLRVHDRFVPANSFPFSGKRASLQRLKRAARAGRCDFDDVRCGARAGDCKSFSTCWTF